MFAFGALIGMLGLPALADIFGRRFAFISSFIIQIIAIFSIIIGIYNNITILMMFGQFMTGIFASGLMIITYVYTA
jgi:MFS family permease